MRIPIPLKRTGNYLGAAILSIACFFGSYLMLKSGSESIDNLDNYEGILIDKGVVTKKSKEVFFIKLQGLNELLATYNPKQSYSDIDRKLSLGDTIKVYFKASGSPNIPNLETFQVERKGEVLLDKSDFQFRENIGGYIALFGGFLIIFLHLKDDRKYWKKNNISS